MEWIWFGYIDCESGSYEIGMCSAITGGEQCELALPQQQNLHSMKKEIITIMAASGLLTVGYSEQEKSETQNTETYSESQQVEQPVDAEMGPEFVDYSGILDSSDIISEGVYNMEEEEIGSVDRLLFNSDSGEVEFAVVSVGGFLGLGDRLVAVPWTEFDVKKEKNSEKMTEAETSEMKEEQAEEVAEHQEEVAEANEEKAEETADNAENSEELAEAKEEQAEENAEIAEEQQEVAETETTETESEVKELVVRLYLDITREQLEKAPEFDSTLPGMTESKEGSDTISEFWKKDWETTKSEKEADKTASL
ncbi:MAG: hypothetical protein CMO55_24950 [Verrucomicrobiales bacterium]|nr:hypothetical protein [Verrucomicrobiales bacterium]